MKLNAAEEYGLRCLLQIARQRLDQSLTIGEISKAEGLSTHNVAKMMRLLRRGGFVRSVRGQTGGYALARPPKEITIGEVMAFLGGRLYDPGFCGRHSGTGLECIHTSNCSVRGLLFTVQKYLDKFLENITLQNLLGTEAEAGGTVREQGASDNLQ